MARAGTDVNNNLTETNFTPHVGQEIRFDDGKTLMLTAVEIAKPPADELDGRHAFTVLLRGPPSPVVPEGLHRLSLPDGQSFELYVIPIHTPSRNYQDYQIVFN